MGAHHGGILRGHEGRVSGALFLSDGRILSWSIDRTLRLWRADGTPDGVLRGHEGRVSGALVLPDERVLSWSADGTLRLWRANGTPEGVLRGREGEARILVYSRTVAETAIRCATYGFEVPLQTWPP
jgi:WD40 repeat protein